MQNTSPTPGTVVGAKEKPLKWPAAHVSWRFRSVSWQEELCNGGHVHSTKPPAITKSAFMQEWSLKYKWFLCRARACAIPLSTCAKKKHACDSLTCLQAHFYKPGQMQISLMEYLTQINANNANLAVHRAIAQTQHPLQIRCKKNKQTNIRL